MKERKALIIFLEMIHTLINTHEIKLIYELLLTQSINFYKWYKIFKMWDKSKLNQSNSF